MTQQGRTNQEIAEQGMRARRDVLGDAHVDRAVAGTTEFTAPFQDFITRYAWGEIWQARADQGGTQHHHADRAGGPAAR